MRDRSETDKIELLWHANTAENRPDADQRALLYRLTEHRIECYLLLEASLTSGHSLSPWTSEKERSHSVHIESRSDSDVTDSDGASFISNRKPRTVADELNSLGPRRPILYMKSSYPFWDNYVDSKRRESKYLQTKKNKKKQRHFFQSWYNDLKCKFSSHQHCVEAGNL